MQAPLKMFGNDKWNTAINRLGKDICLFVFAGSICFALTTATIRMLHSPERGLPYHDRFASSDNEEWIAYGGNWEVQAGTIINESNERGAKLVTGSAYWQDYTVEADVSLQSLGDAGLVARVSDPEQGVDAYRGIYAGLRIRDQALVLGVADHNWQEFEGKTLSTPIVPNSWYHIQLQVKGCKAHAIVKGEDSAELANLEMNIDSCPLRGKIGLRSYDSGGMWKHVQVARIVDSN